jgi:hypothetical protein
MKSLIAVLVLLCAATLAHAESAVTTRATELQAKGQSDAASLAALPENTKVEVLGRTGAWSEVKAAGKTGWVRILHLRFDSAGGTAASSNPMGGLGNLLTSGRTSNTSTSTTGIKGLSAEQVKNAAPNPGEFKKMQSYAVDQSAGQSFSRRSHLSPNKVEYLAGPPPERVETPMHSGG